MGMILMPVKDMLTQRASEIEQLLPHQWVPTRITQGEFAGRLPTNVRYVSEGARRERDSCKREYCQEGLLSLPDHLRGVNREEGLAQNRIELEATTNEQGCHEKAGKNTGRNFQNAAKRLSGLGKQQISGYSHQSQDQE